MARTCTQNKGDKGAKESTKRKCRKKEGDRKTEGKVVGWRGERLEDIGKEKKIERARRRQKRIKKASREGQSPSRTIEPKKK